MKVTNNEKQNVFQLLKKGGKERKIKFIEYVEKKIKQTKEKEIRDIQ